MDEETRRQTRDTARLLERRGQIDAAVQAFLRVGDVDDAARVLVAARRYAEAAQAFLVGAGTNDLTRIRSLDSVKKRFALKAAICLGQAGEIARAVDIFLAVDDRQRAVELLHKVGDYVGAARIQSGSAPPGAAAQGLGHAVAQMPTQNSRIGGGASLQTAQRLEAAGQLEFALEAYVQLKQFAFAARVAKQLGRVSEAAQLYSDAGQPFEAAACHLEIADGARALECLVRVPRDDARYRRAAVQAVRIASDMNALDFQLEHFLTKLVTTGPQDQVELETFYQLAKLYQKNDFIENAKDALRKILAVSPGYRDSAARLAEMEAETRGSAMVYEKILKEEMSFRRDELPRGPRRGAAAADDDLPPLPDLPDLPPLGGAPAPRGRGTAMLRDQPGRATPAWQLADQPASRRETPQRARHSEPPASRAAHGGTEVVSRPPAAEPPSSRAEPPSSRASVPPPVLAEGAIVSDRYQLVKKIGQGGMAVVFKARDLELGEDIAIKIFTTVLDDEQMLTRFKQELSLSRQLSHPNIVRLYDIGAHGGMRFITMELLVGSDLRGRMRQPMGFVQALDYLIQAAAGMQVAHDRGVVHRDIKPENFFVTDENLLKVMDFGIAKRTATPGLTVAGMIAGTPEYMSPEQATDFGAVTSSTDVYALGVVAYEIFTGAVPFTHPEIFPLLMKHVNETPEPPRLRNPTIPADLEQAILRCLAKRPEQRFRSCAELGGALRNVRDRLAAEGVP